MKKLSKDQQQARDDFTLRLETARETANKAIDAANEAIEAYNAAVQDLEVFIEEIVDEAQGWHEDKSEKWQESEAGQAHQDWIDSYRFECEQVPDLEAISEDLINSLNETAIEPADV